MGRTYLEKTGDHYNSTIATQAARENFIDTSLVEKGFNKQYNGTDCRRNIEKLVYHYSRHDSILMIKAYVYRDISWHKFKATINSVRYDCMMVYSP